MKYRKGATGCELLVILAILLAGWFIAIASGERFGLLGYLIGFPLGCVLTFGTLFGVIFLFAVVEGVVSEGIPYLPPCRSGKCTSGLLTDSGDFDPEEYEGQFGYFRCKCGELYERRRSERRVLIVSTNGDKIPYKKWKCCRGWCEDK